ncbi:MAG TPA: pentapeptide repeat-containing protein [bacterium]|nr:pentapeptide repeat-containing protein [bacterium]
MSPGLEHSARYDGETFEGVDFSGKILESSTFTDCTFIRCQFMDATLSHCRLINVVFDHCNLSVLHVPGSTFSGCEINHSKATGIDWTAADWSAPAIRKPLSFLESDLSHSTFLGIKLPDIDIIQSTLRDVDFREAVLTRVSMTGSDLMESLFGKTNLTEADFRGARNYQIDPLQNTITGAKFALPEALSLLYALDIEIDDINDDSRTNAEPR